MTGAGRAVAAVLALVALGCTSARADTDPRPIIGSCIAAAARAYLEPPAILVVLLDVEGGELGRVSQNTNDTVDIGPMQVNQIWVPRIAAHWRAGLQDTFLALRDSFCANVEAGAWILRQALDEARGDFWGGVGLYHSHDPVHKRAYLLSVLQQVLRLQRLGTEAQAAATVPTRPIDAGN